MERFVDLNPAGAEAWPAAATETHISVLLFAGRRVYKLCKPVDLGFIDYSTLEARHRACLAEVEVNRRFAPDVYLGVMTLSDEDGAVHDYAVVMRRLPAERRLAQLVVEGDPAVDDHLREVARLLASVHAAAPRPAEAAQAAGRAAVAVNWEDNLAALEGFVGSVMGAEEHARVAVLARRYLAGRGPLFAARIAAGHALDGHGDLLADDIFCLDDGPRILDCLAFDDRLRYGDALADVAFLAMDLERLGAPGGADLAGRFLRWYGEFSAETHPASLADHYIAYRAHVRAKVACLRAAQGDDHAGGLARGYVQLALRHLEAARVRLVLVGGGPGTGKSVLARGLAEAAGWTLLASDELRKEQAGLAPAADASAPLGEGLYAPEAVEANYTALLERARLLLGLGESVVLDASWASARARTAARQLAEETSTDLVELVCRVPEEEALRRVAARRARGGDPSDATVPVARELAARFEPWPEAVVIETTQPPARCVTSALEVVMAVSQPWPVQG